MRIKAKQIDLVGLSGALVSANFTTGEVVRPYQTGVFSTQEDLSSFEITISGRVDNLSGQLEQTGRYLLTGFLQSGSNLSPVIEATGQLLWDRDEGLSGAFNQTGQNLLATIAGLSGQFNQTGAFLDTLLQPSLISGAFNQTGLNLINLIGSLSGAFNASGLDLYNQIQDPTGITGILELTGITLYNLITGLSGAFNITGANLSFASGGLSGTFNRSGLYLYGLITGLSGAFNISGANLTFASGGLSGTFNNSGLFLYNQILSLSGSFDQTGAILRNNIDNLIDNLTNINGVSGTVALTGAGSLSVLQIGQTFYISGQSGSANPAKVISINALTGDLTLTGTDGIVNTTSGSNLIVLSGIYITTAQTGVFATTGTVSESGAFLVANDANVSGTLTNSVDALSGYLESLIEATNAGVSSINGVSGFVTVIDSGGIGISTGDGILILSGRYLPSFPSYILQSPDIFNPESFDDDFDGTVLDPKWITGLQRGLDYSGISNSHFFFQPIANSAFSQFHVYQNVTTGQDWEMSLKCNLLPGFFNNHGFGLEMSHNLGTRFTRFGYYYSNQSLTAIRQFNSDTSLNSTVFTSGNFFDFKDVYFRVQCRNNTFNFDYSNDGIIWRTIRSNYTNTFITGGVNLVGFGSSSDGGALGVAVDWFRTTGLS